jgi:REP-associated tyrosine transposase
MRIPETNREGWRTQYDPRTHRKKVKHHDGPREIHELTFSCYQRRPLLANPRVCQMLSLAIDRATTKQAYDLIAFVYMPEHVHLLVYPTSPESRISRLLYAIKRPFSIRVKQMLEGESSPLLPKLTIRERPGKTVFRFWQEGGGYDRNILKMSTLKSAIDYIHNNPVRRGLCKLPIEWLVLRTRVLMSATGSLLPVFRATEYR